MVDSSVEKRKKYIELIVAIIVLTFCEWFFFRNVVGNQLLIGDRGDGRLTNLLAEHWWNVFCGRERIGELAMFYPASYALGYTDMFVGFGVIHSLFRLLGIDMFISFKLTIIVIHIMGTITMYYLLNRTLGCSNWWALVGTIAFSYSDTYSRFLGHSQLAAISVLPLLTILLIGFIRNFDNRKIRNIYAYSFVIWFVLLTYNSWYVACFTGLFVLMFLVVCLVMLKWNSVKVWPMLVARTEQVWKDAIGYIIVMGILYIPFIMVCLPVFKSTSGYSYMNCAAYLPELADIINVSTNNWFLGTLIEDLYLYIRGYSYEVEEGFSLILLLLFVSLFIIEKRKVGQAKEEISKQPFSALLMYSLFATVIIAVLSVVRLSSNGVSFWKLIYIFVPVVRSMRAVARFWLWLSFPMAVIVTYAANRYIRFRDKFDIIIPVMFAISIFITNMNDGVNQNWDAQYEQEYINSVAEPPADAHVFYITDSTKSEKDNCMYQLDAYEIANRYGLKTINGYSGQIPTGWGYIWDVNASYYESGVMDWCNKNGLENVYVYDKGTNTWSQAVFAE